MKPTSLFKSGCGRIKEGLLSFLRRREPAEYFVALVLLSLAVFLIRAAIGGPETFASVFFEGGKDLFMDFFNSLRDAAQGVGAYTERRVIYPPLANLLLAFLGLFIPRAYLDTPGGHYEGAPKYTWVQYPQTSLLILFFFILTVGLLCLLIGREDLRKKGLFSFAVILSFPVLCMMERGNVVILAVLCLLVFFQNYKSESAAARELGLLMLAMAVALKIYPVLFGTVLLVDKKYREAFRAAGYTLLLLLIPSLFFGGPISIWWILQNMFSFSGYTSQAVGAIGTDMGLPAWFGTAFLFFLYFIAVVLLTLSSLLQKKTWKTWVFAATVLLSVTSVFTAYNWLMVLPGLLLFCRTERLEGTNWLYFILMTLPFLAYVPGMAQRVMLIVTLAGLYLLSIAEAVILFRGFFKARREKKEAAD